MSKIISEETIENLKQLIRNRNSYIDIKEVFDNLEDVDSQQVNAIKCSNNATSSGISQKTADILKDEIKFLFDMRTQLDSPDFKDTDAELTKEDIDKRIKELENNRPEQPEGDVHESEKRNVVQSPSPSGDAIINDLKFLLKNKGRGSILESDIRDIINKYSEE